MIGIKDMSMPERCDICPFYLGVNEGKCLIDMISFDGSSMYNPGFYRQDWCPLVEIEEGEGEDNE